MERGDGKLRALERAAGQGDPAADHRYLAALRRRLGDDVSSQARLLEGRLRVGQVTGARVRLAARLGDPAAQALVGSPALSTEPGPWLEELQAGWGTVDDDAGERTLSRATLSLLRPLVEAETHPLKEEILAYAESRLACSTCFWGSCEEHEDREVLLLQSLAGNPADPHCLLFVVLGQLPVVGTFAEERWEEGRAAFVAELLSAAGGPPCAICGAACGEDLVDCEFCHHAHHPDCLVEDLIAAPVLEVDEGDVVFACGRCGIETVASRGVVEEVERRRGITVERPVSKHCYGWPAVLVLVMFAVPLAALLLRYARG